MTLTDSDQDLRVVIEITIAPSTVEDQPPQFLQEQYTFDVPENDTVPDAYQIGSLSVTDEGLL